MEILTWGQACIDGVYMELRKPLLIEKLFNPNRKKGSEWHNEADVEECLFGLFLKFDLTFVERRYF